MKKSLLLTALLCFSAFFLKGQDVIPVTLDEDNPCANNVVLDLGVNISVCTIATDEANDKATVSIKIENTRESEWIIVFNQPKDKKELQRMRYVNETGAEIVACTNLFNDVVLMPEEEIVIANIEIQNGKELQFRIPFYLAKERKMGLFRLCKRTVLYMMKQVEVRITYDARPDKDYDRISGEVEQLFERYKNAIDNHEFCTHPNHHPSFKKQTQQIVGERDDLRLSINLKLNEKLTEKQKGKYHGLIDKLDAIDFSTYSYDCGDASKHNIHDCGYCDWTLAQIYRQLESYYMDVKSGSKTKAEVLPMAEELKICADKSRKSPARRKESASVKEKIKKYYNNIKALP